MNEHFMAQHDAMETDAEHNVSAVVLAHSIQTGATVVGFQYDPDRNDRCAAMAGPSFFAADTNEQRAMIAGMRAWCDRQESAFDL
ncbi:MULTISPECIES: hypothetical protein [unclassified Ruegeria]|uniref:hypothetical protein n=1 Tax=unclassified Ruegeria TaxID=2625375 RepID=UPI0014890D6C|nr:MULTISPECIES: hypothetical protein [unclassified Ruegeria]